MTRALAWLLGALFVVVPLAHVPALRNLLAFIATVLVAIVLLRERRPLPLPAWLLFAWIALGAASALWSPDPSVTLHDVFYDMLLPAGVFLAAWRSASEPAAFDRLRWATCAGLLCLGAIIAFVLASGGPASTLLTDDIASGIAHYWPGVGIASTFAVLILPFGLIFAVSNRLADRCAGVAVFAAGLAVGIVSQNRIIWPAALVTAGVFAAWLWPTFSTAARRLAVGLICVSAVAAWGAFHYAQRERQLDTQPLTHDLRLAAWREWAGIALRKPLLGHGLGRTLLTSEGRRSISPELQRRDPVYTWHAHNLPIDIAVQLGIVGLALYLALLAALLREYWRLGGRGTPRAARVLGAAGFALIVAMLAKNSTDDFMGKAVAIAFWGYAGLLLGPLSRRS